MILLIILAVIVIVFGVPIYYFFGMIAYALGFTATGILKDSIAAGLMSYAWVSGLFVPIISFLQSAGVAFGNLAAACWL